MQLATINSKVENKVLHKLMISLGIGEDWPNSVWIAGHEMGHEGQYYWITNGRRLNYTNWDAGEPNNLTIRDNVTQDCLGVFISKEQLVWDDKQCEFLFHPACEYYNVSKTTAC